MKHFLIALAVCFFSISLKAQEPKSVSLNLYGGYALKDRVNFDGYYGYVNAAFEYGAGLEFFPQRTKSFELRYLRMDTDFPLYGVAGTQLNKGKEKGSANYILVGGNNYFGGNPKSKAMPYIGAGVGLGIVDSKNGGSATKFAWDAKLGVKIKSKSTVSLNLHAYVQSIISAVGSDYYVTGGGLLISVPDYTSIFQFGVGGALCFNFKKK